MPRSVMGRRASRLHGDRCWRRSCWL